LANCVRGLIAAIAHLRAHLRDVEEHAARVRRELRVIPVRLDEGSIVAMPAFAM
jgi:hypothetical protein